MRVLRFALVFMLGCVVVVMGVFVWPTRYRYDHLGAVPVRINRMTGRAEMLEVEGWNEMKSRVNPPEAGLSGLGIPSGSFYYLSGGGAWCRDFHFEFSRVVARQLLAENGEDGTGFCASGSPLEAGPLQRIDFTCLDQNRSTVFDVQRTEDGLRLTQPGKEDVRLFARRADCERKVDSQILRNVNSYESKEFQANEAIRIAEKVRGRPFMAAEVVDYLDYARKKFLDYTRQQTEKHPEK